MKNWKVTLTLALAFALAPLTAHAGYSEALAKQKVCRATGRYAVGVYVEKQKGVTEADLRASQGKVDLALDLTIQRVYASEGTEKDAYMAGWAACMDNN